MFGRGNRGGNGIKVTPISVLGVYVRVDSNHGDSCMTEPHSFDKIELSLVRLFHTVITERSISRAALRLQTTQPAVSAKLKRLRELTGDPLLVRAGHGMVPTPAALALMEPAADLLRSAQAMFGSRSRGLDFDPASSRLNFRVAASDWLDPMVLPELVGRIKAQAPGGPPEIPPATGGEH